MYENFLFSILMDFCFIIFNFKSPHFLIFNSNIYFFLIDCGEEIQTKIIFFLTFPSWIKRITNEKLRKREKINMKNIQKNFKKKFEKIKNIIRPKKVLKK